MHLYCLTRGIKHDVDRFINDLQAQYFNMPNYKKGNIVQLGVRPVQFWEIVFPKEALDQVLPTVIHGGHKFNVWEEFLMKRLRAMLKAKKIPVFDANAPRRMVYHQNVECTGIGIKDDIDHPTEGHEML